MIINRIIKKYFVLNIVIGIFLIICIPVSAQEKRVGIQVSPAIISLSLSPGKTISQTIKISNITETQIPMRLSTYDLQSPDDDTTPLPLSRASELLKWLTISPKDIVLGPHETKEITLTIQPPNVVRTGGYYATLYLESLVIQSANINNSRVIPNILIPIFTGVNLAPVKSHEAEIISPQLPFIMVRDTNTQILFNVANNDIFHFSAQPKLAFQNIISREDFNSKFEEKIVFPGKSRKWNVPFKVSQNPGIYKEILSISVGNGLQKQHTQYVFIAPSIWTMIFIFISILIFIFIQLRKNIVRAIRAIIFNE